MVMTTATSYSTPAARACGRFRGCGGRSAGMEKGGGNLWGCSPARRMALLLKLPDEKEALTRRLKYATTSGGRCKRRVAWGRVHRWDRRIVMLMLFTLGGVGAAPPPHAIPRGATYELRILSRR